MPRVRTGCMTCRKRRRKCDEEKPECRNCRTKDLTCRYGVNYTFVQYSQQAGQKRRRDDPLESSGDHSGLSRDQSTRTVAPQSTAIPPDDYQEQYDPPHSTPQTPGVQLGDEFLPITQPIENQSLSPGRTQTGHREAQQAGGLQTTDLQTEAHLCMAPTVETPSNVSHCPHQRQSQTLGSPGTSQFGHSAARSLYSAKGQASLHGKDRALEIWPVLYGSRSLPSPFGTSLGSLPTYPSAYRRASHVVNDLDNPLTRTPPHKPTPAYHLDDESLEFELLSHFRYAIGPQLDLSSECPYWTVQALRQSVSDMKLRCAILALSSQSRAYACNRDFDFYAERSNTFAAQASHESLPMTGEKLPIQVLLGWKCLLENAPGKWLESSRQKGLAGPYEQSTSAPYLLWTRLRLASVLVAPISCVLQTDALFDAAGSPPTSDHAATRQLRQVMSLLHRSFSHHHNQPRQSQQTSPAMAWQAFWVEAQTWFSARIGEMRPIFEHQDLHDIACIESQAQVFPIVLFSNLHGVLANSTFHLAAIILLQCKPRLLRVSAKPALMLSPTWHIIRILGIAEVAVSGGFYDPLLVSAIIKASRMLSNNEQLAGAANILYRVQIATGMKLDDELRSLEKMQEDAI